MRVSLDVLLPLLLIDFSAKILHDRAGLAVGSYGDNWPELAALDALSWKRRSHSDDDLEVVVGLVIAAWLRV